MEEKGIKSMGQIEFDDGLLGNLEIVGRQWVQTKAIANLASKRIDELGIDDERLDALMNQIRAEIEIGGNRVGLMVRALKVVANG